MRRRDPAFCFGVAGTAKAPWRPTLDQAKADAIEAGMATRYEGERTIYITVPGEIWYTYDLVPVMPRDPEPILPVETSAPALSRIDRIIARREAKA